MLETMDCAAVDTRVRKDARTALVDLAGGDACPIPLWYAIHAALGLPILREVGDADEGTDVIHCESVDGRAALYAAMGLERDTPTSIDAEEALHAVAHAAGALLARIDDMTSLDFARAGERIEREALRSALEYLDCLA